MAVALEVGWGSGELGGIAPRMSKKRAWGDDHQKLLEMMMGKPFDESGAGAARHHTLDLLGGRAASSTASIAADGEQQQSDFLELGEDVPLPNGWEKRLDLKSGTVFFINWNTGKTTYADPRKSSGSSSSQPSTCHMSLELLQSELAKKMNAGVVSSTKSTITKQSTKALVDDTPAAADTGGNEHRLHPGGLDLQLNLSSSKQQDEDTSSVTTSSECLCLLPPAATSPKSPSPKLAPTCVHLENAGAAAAKVTLTACKRCLMYVMISQLDPRCPRCGSSVILDFPVPKKQRTFDLEL